MRRMRAQSGHGGRASEVRAHFAHEARPILPRCHHLRSVGRTVRMSDLQRQSQSACADGKDCLTTPTCAAAAAAPGGRGGAGGEAHEGSLPWHGRTPPAHHYCPSAGTRDGRHRIRDGRPPEAVETSGNEPVQCRIHNCAGQVQNDGAHEPGDKHMRRTRVQEACHRRGKTAPAARAAATPTEYTRPGEGRMHVRLPPPVPLPPDTQGYVPAGACPVTLRKPCCD